MACLWEGWTCREDGLTYVWKLLVFQESAGSLTYTDLLRPAVRSADAGLAPRAAQAQLYVLSSLFEKIPYGIQYLWNLKLMIPELFKMEFLKHRVCSELMFFFQTLCFDRVWLLKVFTFIYIYMYTYIYIYICIHTCTCRKAVLGVGWSMRHGRTPRCAWEFALGLGRDTGAWEFRAAGIFSHLLFGQPWNSPHNWPTSQEKRDIQRPIQRANSVDLWSLSHNFRVIWRDGL